jgi:hypothetical protein
MGPHPHVCSFGGCSGFVVFAGRTRTKKRERVWHAYGFSPSVAEEGLHGHLHSSFSSASWGTLIILFFFLALGVGFLTRPLAALDRVSPRKLSGERYVQRNVYKLRIFGGLLYVTIAKRNRSGATPAPLRYASGWMLLIVKTDDLSRNVHGSRASRAVGVDNDVSVCAGVTVNHAQHLAADGVRENAPGLAGNPRCTCPACAETVG